MDEIRRAMDTKVHMDFMEKSNSFDFSVTSEGSYVIPWHVTTDLTRTLRILRMTLWSKMIRKHLTFSI